MRAWLKEVAAAPRSAVFRSSFRNAAFNVAEHVLHPVLWLLATPIYFASLGGELYGIWLLLQAVIGSAMLLQFGLTDATVKFVVTYRARGDLAAVARVVHTTLVTYLALSVTTGWLLYGAAPFVVRHIFHPSAAQFATCLDATRLLAAGIVLRFFHSVWLSAIQGFERYDLAARIGMLSNALSVAAGVLLLRSGYGLVWLVRANVLLLLAQGLVEAAIVSKVLLRGIAMPAAPDRATLREILGFGVFSGIESAMSNLGQQLDSFIVACFAGPVAVGYYGTARRLPMQAHVLLARAFEFLFPLSGKLLESGDTTRLRRIYDKSSQAVVIMVGGLLAPVFLFGGDFMALWIGPEFARQANPLMMVLCVRFAQLPLDIVNRQCLLGSGHVRVLALITTVSTLITLAAVAGMTPWMGVMGAALANLVVFPLIFFTRLYIEHRIFGTYSVRTTVAYYIVIAGPLLAAGAVWAWRSAPPLMAWRLGPALGLTALLSWGLSLALARLLRGIRWLPSS